MFSIFRRKRPLRAVPKLQSAMAAIDPTDPSDNDLLFFAIFGGAHTLWDNLNRTPKLPAKFKSDGICFEIAAYMLFRTDFHAYRLDPSWRQEVIPKLHDQSEIIFREALGFTPEAHAEILNNRLEILGHIVRNTGAIAEVIEALLLRFIYDTAAHDGIPQYGLDHHKPFPIDQTAEYITDLLQSWHSTAVECAHEAVQGCLEEN